MMSFVNLNSRMNALVLYVNCQECGAPLINETLRVAGICADCAEVLPGDVDAYDPYGQPILNEVAA